MASTNPENVYFGSSSVKDYYNPDLQPPLPLVELPDKLNPFKKDGVRIYAKMMSTLPANNVKSIPALNMLSSITPEIKTIIEYSSGSTVISMSLIARALYGIDDTRAFLSNKTSIAKLQMIRFFGLNITLFGGPSQPEPSDIRGGIYRAQEMAEERDDTVNPNQYINDANWMSHMKWTGPQIMKQLPSINIFCAGMGTSGTMTGIGTYLKQTKPSIVRVGVCTKAGDRVPGPRSLALLAPVTFPWAEATDEIEEVGSFDSYKLSLELSREGLICGPSSGFNLQGLYNYLGKQRDNRRLHELAGEDGNIHCVFICCDLPYQYLDDYFTKLGEDYFHPLQNDDLLDVDLYRYDESWEVEALDTLEDLYSIDLASNPPQVASGTTLLLQPNNLIIDLRSPDDFAKTSLLHSISKPLSSLSPATKSPFFDSSVMKAQWLELEAMFSQVVGEYKGQKITVICYNGDTSRVATSVLRAKGVEACSLKGGMPRSRFLRNLMMIQNSTSEDFDKGESDDGICDMK